MKCSMSLNQIGRVYAGFPGIGKSKWCAEHPDYADSDSSTFDKSDFPRNYIEHIREVIKTRPIMCSTHETVRNALIEAGIPFTLVYPAPECREEYIQRYIDRGSPDSFVAMMEKNFDMFVQQCQAVDNPLVSHTVLGAGEFITDRLEA